MCKEIYDLLKDDDHRLFDDPEDEWERIKRETRPLRRDFRFRGIDKIMEGRT